MACHFLDDAVVTGQFGIFVYYRTALGTFLLLGLSQGWLEPVIS